MALQALPNGLPTTVTAKFPHLSGCTALQLPPLKTEQLQALLTGQLAVVMRDAEGRALDVTGAVVACAPIQHAVRAVRHSTTCVAHTHTCDYVDNL